jgi:hypothetical protein
LPTLGRILRQFKKFIDATPNSRSSYDWQKVMECLTHVFRSRVYFNKWITGGNRRYYDKLVSDKIYSWEH